MIHFAHNIEGFFGLEDFVFYQKIVEHTNTNSHIVEIGSYKGRSSAFMAVEIINSKKNIKLDCVDTWLGSPEHQQSQVYEDQAIIDNRLYEVFLKNMEPVNGIFKPIRKNSVEASRDYQDRTLDLVFIDADHEYESVCADIQAWKPKIKSRGIISGHDWHHPPIKRAVHELLGTPHVIGNCWYTFQPLL